MAPPSPGNYYIKNKASGYFLTSDGTNKSFTPVPTTKPTGDLSESECFNLRKTDGDLYVISSTATGSNVGSPANVADGSAVIWTVGDQYFKITDAGPGVFNIRLSNENRFWYDEVAMLQPSRVVLLKSGQTDDSCYWIFQAA
ncbi:hypothetical protein GYMLUDRAFT_43538 [Collybiopsis luxurians FD-317 M1]|uniref:Ricin B lectin domain-containing protein n=1 Tax=Collybiopsis luxurians FD-317 M1 TaxID=944289 RepID=A0A0D0CP51_9AGAR|nr:hypothetical protein GYMLUDRAFT_43538 [Collybiopsis luxurians FD-317 M1]